MKKLILTLIIVAATMAVKAQTAPKQIAVNLQPSQLVLLQNVLRFSYDNLITSRGASGDVQDARKAIEQLFPLLVPAVADTTKVKPVKK